jgi:predicted ribosomally synthesized peptide with nif11-like leader
MNFADFKKKLFADKEFAEKFKGIKDAAELIKAAAAEGFTFTEEDMKNNTELTPEELEMTAGGGHIGPVDFSTSFISW